LGWDAGAFDAGSRLGLGALLVTSVTSAGLRVLAYRVDSGYWVDLGAYGAPKSPDNPDPPG
ncbi:MAG TPA: hypothetical protein VGU21_07670, partial [Streptosporangiaceae bacterium]|nr:hypothetical protein [Streptosporangiaceae bacterium]